MRLEFRHFENNGFNLCGEYIHAAYNEHIVTTSENTVHTHQCTSARTFVIVQSRKVFSAITQQRHAFFSKVGKYQLSRFTRRNRFKCFRVYYLRKIMIFVKMRTILAFTFIPYTRTRYFTQSINVISLYSQFRFNIATHILRPRLCTECTDFQFELLTRKTRILNGVRQIQRIRRRTTEYCRTEIMHQCNLLFRITTGHRNNRSTDILGACVRPQSAGKQSVSVRYLKNIRTACAIRRKST